MTEQNFDAAVTATPQQDSRAPDWHGLMMSGQAQVSHRPLAGSCMKQDGQIAGGTSTRFRGAGSARGRRAVEVFARDVAGEGSARNRAVSAASSRLATTVSSHSEGGIRV